MIPDARAGALGRLALTLAHLPIGLATERPVRADTDGAPPPASAQSPQTPDRSRR